MAWTQRVVLLILGLGLLGLVLHLLRRCRLGKAAAALWVLTSLAILAVVLAPGVLAAAAEGLGLDPGVLMLLVVLVFLAAIVLHGVVVVSRSAEREKELSQELDRLRGEVDELRQEMRELPPPAAEPRHKPPSLRT